MSEQLTAADVQVLRDAARAGNVKVQYKLGQLLKYCPELGEPGEFAQWLSTAAERGSGEACWELADTCLNRGGAAPDYERARAYLLLGATLAEPMCLYQLGMLYLTGTGVSADAALGFNYTLRAAKLGDATAQHNAGVCFLRGLGTGKDLAQAKEWFTRAQAAGEPRASSMLQEVEREVAAGAR
jgi:TPR repeat protein